MRTKLIGFGIALVWLSVGCGGGSPSLELEHRVISPAGVDTIQQSVLPTTAEMESLLHAQLAECGIVPGRQITAAPSSGSEVINLEAILVDPDGSGPELPTGFRLTWVESLVGDYDMNGEVNVSDLTPIVMRWHEIPLYDDPAAHDGIESFPVGDPEFAGDVADTEPPLADSGAFSWRLRRVDGDGNGEINLADISPIGIHFGERLDGYRVYRRGPSEVEFSVLEDAAQPGIPLLIERATANAGAGINPNRPVLYDYYDEFAVDGIYEYRVVPYDSQSDSEGPVSHPGFDKLSPVQASITADVTQGGAPLLVSFDASASTSVTSPIADYSWDLDGDGLLEEYTGNNPLISRKYLVVGSWLASVQVENADGDTSVASVLISVTTPPVAQLKASPQWLEVPLDVTFDATSSFDVDGEVVRYKWDMDNDGDFELDTGPLATRVVEYLDPGMVTVGVQVTDDKGAKASTTLTVSMLDEYGEEENNDSAGTAMQLGLFAPGESLTDLTGAIGPDGYDGDEQDWFSFSVPTGVQATAQLVFAHADSNLSLQLYGPGRTELISAAESTTDNEQLSAPLLSADTYYLRVFRALGPGGASAHYQLNLAISELVYDEVEDNDSHAQALDLGNIDDGLLQQYIGSLGPAGLDGDSEDWLSFEIGLTAVYQIDLRFLHSLADLELQLFEDDGTTLIGASSSVSDNEQVTAELSPGRYFVRISRFDGATANYNLTILMQ